MDPMLPHAQAGRRREAPCSLPRAGGGPGCGSSRAAQTRPARGLSSGSVLDSTHPSVIVQVLRTGDLWWGDGDGQWFCVLQTDRRFARAVRRHEADRPSGIRATLSGRDANGNRFGGLFVLHGIGIRPGCSRSVFRCKPGLLTELVRCDPIKLAMPLDRNGVDAIGVDGLVAAFAQQVEAVGLEGADAVTPFDRHDRALRAVAQGAHSPEESPFRARGTPRASR